MSVLQSIDEFPVINGEKGQSIPGLPLSLEHVLNKSNFFYGGTETGKTTLILYILYLLSPVIGLCLLFCPSTEAGNTDYSGIVPDAVIHTQIDPKKFKYIADLQAAKTKEYAYVSNKKNIRNLYKYVASKEIDNHVRKANKLYRTYASMKREEYGNNRGVTNELKRMKNMITTMKYNMFRKQISKFKKKIPVHKLSYNEKMALKFIDLNPFLLVIFDDCTEDLKDICKKKENPKYPECKEFFKFISQGRHKNITTIAVSHNQSSMDKGLRLIAHNSFFSDSTSASAFFDPSNEIDKPTCKRVRETVSLIYAKDEYADNHNKLCYCKINNPQLFYTHVPNPKKFKNKFVMGCPDVLRELQKMTLSKEETGISVDNIYKQDFED